ncbi:MAG: histone H1 [Smithellaceae bacterium]
MKKVKVKHPDFCQLAAAIVEEATDENPQEPEPETKNPHAVALGRLGGLKGGKARADKLTPSQRRRIAIKAAHARWKKK